jgi:hypothetical protein
MFEELLFVLGFNLVLLTVFGSFDVVLFSDCICISFFSCFFLFFFALDHLRLSFLEDQFHQFIRFPIFLALRSVSSFCIVFLRFPVQKIGFNNNNKKTF